MRGWWERGGGGMKVKGGVGGGGEVGWGGVWSGGRGEEGGVWGGGGGRWRRRVGVRRGKMVKYGWGGGRERKVWWRWVGVVRWKWVVGGGYRGERVMEGCSRWLGGKFG